MYFCAVSRSRSLITHSIIILFIYFFSYPNELRLATLHYSVHKTHSCFEIENEIQREKWDTLKIVLQTMLHVERMDKHIIYKWIQRQGMQLMKKIGEVRPITEMIVNEKKERIKTNINVSDVMDQIKVDKICLKW